MSLNDLSDELTRARDEARMLDAKAWRDTITDVGDGYAVQSLLAQRAGHGVRGWKVTALGAEQQKLYLSDRPVAGALLAPFVHRGPAPPSPKPLVPPVLECQLSVPLGSDRPPPPAFSPPVRHRAAGSAGG